MILMAKSNKTKLNFFFRFFIFRILCIGMFRLRRFTSETVGDRMTLWELLRLPWNLHKSPDSIPKQFTPVYRAVSQLVRLVKEFYSSAWNTEPYFLTLLSLKFCICLFFSAHLFKINFAKLNVNNLNLYWCPLLVQYIIFSSGSIIY